MTVAAHWTEKLANDEPVATCFATNRGVPCGKPRLTGHVVCESCHAPDTCPKCHPHLRSYAPDHALGNRGRPRGRIG